MSRVKTQAWYHLYIGLKILEYYRASLNEMSDSIDSIVSSWGENLADWQDNSENYQSALKEKALKDVHHIKQNIWREVSERSFAVARIRTSLSGMFICYSPYRVLQNHRYTD